MNEIKKWDNNKKYEVYPNPTDGLLVLVFPEGFQHAREVKVFNAVGVEVGSYQIIEYRTVLDISHYPSGVYMLVEYGETPFLPKKVVIR